MANQFFGMASGGSASSQLGVLGQQPVVQMMGMMSEVMDPATNDQPLQFVRLNKPVASDKESSKEVSSSSIANFAISSSTSSCNSHPGIMESGAMISPAATNAMMNANMMMPWAAMMGHMMDPSMMMWGTWGGMGMVGTVAETEALPQAQREVIKLKDAVLYPPPPNSLPPSTRERPPGCKTVFIGGLPENVTEEILQEMFSNCGQVYCLRLSKKNFAHVRFTSMEAVDKALFYSGYRMKVCDKDDKANVGRIHVDFAQARDDLHEWECFQRQLQRESRHRERLEESLLRPPSPPAIVHYSDHEAMLLTDSLKDVDSFPKAVQTLQTWLERGDCNRRTSNTFYTLIQSANGHVRRLQSEKKEYADELEQMKAKYRLKLETIVNLYDQINRTFAAASKQKSWDHFTKAQRKNLEMWRKQLQSVKVRQEAELSQSCGEAGEAEMEMSDTEADTDSDSPNAASKRRRITQDILQPTPQTTESMLTKAAEWIGTSQLRIENDTLKCQLEALKNEVDLIKQESNDIVEDKEKQMKCMEMALQGMQQQLLKMTEQLKELKSQKSKLDAGVDSNKSNTDDSDQFCEIVDDADDVKRCPSATVRVDSGEADAYNIRREPGVSASQTPSSSTFLSMKEARIITAISTFLVVHPAGANIDHIWQYLSRVGLKIRSSELEELLEKCQSVFTHQSTHCTNDAEKRWKFIALDQTYGDSKG